MARKKTEAAKVKATQAELRTVRLALPADDHKKFRRLAAANDTNMALLARKIVQDYIAKHQGKEGPK